MHTIEMPMYRFSLDLMLLLPCRPLYVVQLSLRMIELAFQTPNFIDRMTNVSPI
jgi:hypothetical protein